MFVGMVAVKAYQDALFFNRYCFDLCDDLWRDTRALNHRYSTKHRVSLDCITIVFTYVDVQTKHFGILCTTTGGGFGQTVEQRVAVVETYSPELASLNAGSLNFALHPVLNRITIILSQC